MAWNRDEARERIKKSFDELADLKLEPLKKDMYLWNLSPKECRVVTGVHLYLDPVNFQDLLAGARENSEELKKLLRHIHVYQRQLSWLVADVDGGQQVHFQGARLHAVFYKPYDSSGVAAPALKRLTAAWQYVSQARELCALVSEHTGITFNLEAGLECGDAIATVNGEVGARELLFIGAPANTAAKILTGVAGDRFGEEAEKLKADLPKPDPLPERYKTKVKEDVEAFPVSKFETYEPTDAAIDYDALGVRTADLKSGITCFADIAGFTGHVASLETDAEKIEALRGFHAARSEMHHVLRDYALDFIQYQGDRIQGLAYEAKGSSRYAEKAVEAAAAMTDSFDICREELPGFADLDITNGVAVGRVFVTRVGIKGEREKLVLGRSVPRASQIQDESERGWTGINRKLRDLLPSDIQGVFEKDGDDRYEAELSMDVLDALEDAKNYVSNVKVVGSPATGQRVVAAPTEGVRPAKSWRR